MGGESESHKRGERARWKLQFFLCSNLEQNIFLPHTDRSEQVSSHSAHTKDNPRIWILTRRQTSLGTIL